jgi:hypothetical protein
MNAAPVKVRPPHAVGGDGGVTGAKQNGLADTGA